MPSDRARRTFDAAQQYRAVVWQQGRVTLEADHNEAEELRASASRDALLDIIGAAGTPDDGYRVSVPAASTTPFDFAVGAGTMYVGGERVTATAPSGWLAQAAAEWLDVPQAVPQNVERELVLLWLEETEVSAVEDGALREPALGGPDTTQRLRFLQHLLRRSVKATECPAAVKEVAEAWRKLGLELDAATRTATSLARVQVSYEPVTGPSGPCDPAAQSGYLGADNQLVRIGITNPGRLLWGFDDASFLYGVTPDGGSSTVLQLGTAPVDAHHQPRAGQTVELLRATARLANGEYVAAPTGFVTTLASTYEPDGRTVKLTAAPPGEYLDPKQTPRLFLRVWEAELPFTLGTAVTLGTTGVRVTVTGATGVAGDFWMIGVRPGVPQAVFPQRYLEAPQPPDGPRRLFTPLALVRWTGPRAAEITDCRNRFDDLVELSRARTGGCCTITIAPAGQQAVDLQKLIDDAIVGKQESLVVCLQPGRYLLRKPLELDKRHAGVTLHACAPGVVLAAAPDAAAAFADGLIVIAGARDVVVEGLRFELPLTALEHGRFQLDEEGKRSMARLIGRRRAFLSVGVQAVAATGLALRDCELTYASAAQGTVMAVGVRIAGGCRATTIEGCRFISTDTGARATDATDQSFGVYATVPTQLERTPLAATGAAGARAAVRLKAKAQAAVIDELTVRGCRFERIDIAVALGPLLGTIVLADNVVRGARRGFDLRHGLVGVDGLPKVDVGGTTTSGPGASAPGTLLELVPELVKNADNLLAGDAPLALAEVVHRTYGLIAPAALEPATVDVRTDDVDREDREAWSSFGRGLLALAAAPSIAAPPVGTTPTPAPAAPRAPVTSQPAAPAASARARLVGELADIDELRDQLARIDLALGKQPVASLATLRLQVTNNDIRTVREGVNIAFRLRNDPRLAAGELVIAGNRMVVRSRWLPAMLVDHAQRCTVSGNVLVNDEPDQEVGPFSLMVWTVSRRKTGAPVAVTGNSCVGDVVLPARPGVPAPLDDWKWFNAIER